MKPRLLYGSTLIAICIGLSASPVFAQWRAGGRWIDASGELVITVLDRWGRSCVNGTAQASYTVAGGSDWSSLP